MIVLFIVSLMVSKSASQALTYLWGDNAMALASILSLYVAQEINYGVRC